VALVAAIALALSSGSASAATVFGADMTQQPVASTTTQSVVNVIAPGGGVDNGAPASGILTSVRIKTNGTAGDGFIRILTEVSHPDLVTYEFINHGPDIPVHVTADAAPAGHITEVQTRQPISAGQRLAWYVDDSGGTINEGYASATAECAYIRGPAGGPDTSSHAYDTFSCPIDVLLASGTIEADSDGDGYGDETQDSCPAYPQIHDGACPVKGPPPTFNHKKCKKKHHRAAKVAKKKCKKKKKH
jgi:hypothetical protein